MTTQRPAYLDKTYDMFLGSIDGEQAETIRFSEWMDEVCADGAYPFEASRKGQQGAETEVERVTGEALRVLNYSCYNYLGLSHHPAVIEAGQAALARYGLGAGSSPVQGGTFAVHRALERRLAELHGVPGYAASLFTSGYAVNSATIAALMKRRDHIIMDRGVHMSILKGAQLSRANLSYYEHNDVDDLRAALARVCDGKRRVLVCTEGCFSADGDFGALREVSAAAREFGAKVLVDEAHSYMVTGPTGRGVAEAQGVLDQIDLYVITFSKALGGVGGALLAPAAVVRYINWYARARMFSAGMPPVIAAGTLAALELAAGPEGAARRARLAANAERLRERLRGRVDLGKSESWIVTVHFGEDDKTIPLLDMLQREGLDAGVMQFPAAPINEARLRLFVTAEHKEAHLDRAAALVLAAAERFGFLLGG